MQIITVVYAGGMFLLILGTWRRWRKLEWGGTLAWIGGTLLASAQISDLLQGCEEQLTVNLQTICNFVPAGQLHL